MHRAQAVSAPVEGALYVEATLRRGIRPPRRKR